jgi:hypothetical protein
MAAPSHTDRLVGRRSIFRGKLRTLRVQGIMSRDGMRAFKAARRQLAKLAGVRIVDVSDADTIEFLARGAEDTRKYLGR